MRLLAEFIMSNRMRAVIGISALGLLSLILPPLSLLSAAGIALVALRKGLKDGLDVMLYAALACGAVGFLILANGLAVSGYLLLQWAPLLVLALWLRSSRSLANTVVLALGLGGLVILFSLLWFDDAAGEWRTFLQPLEKAFADAQMLDAESRETVMSFLAQWMTGVLAAGYFLQTVFALLLARWWQALLYNPGGFRQEFHQLRLPKTLAGVAAATIAASLVISAEQVDTLDYLALLFLSAGFIQGLALVHGAAGLRNLNVGWLVGMYLLLFIAPAQTISILATAGLVDVWFDFRARLGANANRSQGPDA